MIIRGALESGGTVDDRLLRIVRSDHLKTDRESLAVKPAGNGRRGKTYDIYKNRINVS